MAIRHRTESRGRQCDHSYRTDDEAPAFGTVRRQRRVVHSMGRFRLGTSSERREPVAVDQERVTNTLDTRFNLSRLRRGRLPNPDRTAQPSDTMSVCRFPESWPLSLYCLLFPSTRESDDASRLLLMSNRPRHAHRSLRSCHRPVSRIAEVPPASRPASTRGHGSTRPRARWHFPIPAHCLATDIVSSAPWCLVEIPVPRARNHRHTSAENDAPAWVCLLFVPPASEG